MTEEQNPDGYRWGQDNDKVPGIMAQSREGRPKRSFFRRIWARVCAVFGVDGDNIFSVRK